MILTGLVSRAQVKFTASVSPVEIGKEEYAQLKLTVNNAGEVQEISLPDLKNFSVIGGPSQESGMSMENGVVKRYVAWVFLIKPKATGNFTIPPAFAKADGRILKSNAVTLNVLANPTGNNTRSNPFSSPFAAMDPFFEPVPRAAYDDYILRENENPLDKIKKNMFVQADVDKKSVYVGEPVVATYKLFTRLRSESNMIKNPSFNGFSVLDLQQPADMSTGTEKSGGREYNVYILRKAQLYPLLAGNLELGSAEIENNVRFIKAEFINRRADLTDEIFRDFANGSIPADGMIIRKVTLQSKPLSVLVKPLPELNRPGGFKGAVGYFKIEARVEKSTIGTDDAGRMAVVISGEGNLQMINAPTITWPAGIEGFDSKATDDLYKGTVPVSGRKIFEFPFTVSKAGTYQIPPLNFSFFDLRDGSYKTISTKPIDITVTKGTGKPKSLKNDTRVNHDGNYLARFFNNRLRAVSLFAVLIILGLILWLNKDAKKGSEPTEPSAVSSQEQSAESDEKETEELLLTQGNPLAASEECLQRGEAGLFYTQLNQELKFYLSRKFAIPAEELNRKNIIEQLDQKGVNNETSVQLQELMDRIEWELYTPHADMVKLKDMYERTEDIIQLLNTYRG